MSILKEPWPWYVAGILIGLTVPVLLIAGNKQFGISANLRHICASCFPGKVSFFRYDWRKERWNLVFAAGILIGGYIAATFLSNGQDIKVNPELVQQLKSYGITDYSNMVPRQLFNFGSLLTLRGWVMLVGGGFLVGFGTRYAGGCTSGHSIMGLSTLQWPSLVATICFMAGGFIMANLILPFILAL
ncbi:hypothetical protein SAMN04488132_102443 [Sediminibacterium ginsengisoli]|uniref:Sulphur transport domain-containing protein n=2 Tax=Sediminibacterium ginsengisoli TaxID=413434 RepID=A0A1T4LDD9_9BACT|nr:hypothetical protein SAMN04488132_102443 [Sediminibacterium ginsengisoli]